MVQEPNSIAQEIYDELDETEDGEVCDARIGLPFMHVFLGPLPSVTILVDTSPFQEHFSFQ